jgi:hypothetical protein
LPDKVLRLAVTHLEGTVRERDVCDVVSANGLECPEECKDELTNPCYLR